MLNIEQFFLSLNFTQFLCKINLLKLRLYFYKKN